MSADRHRRQRPSGRGDPVPRNDIVVDIRDVGELGVRWGPQQDQTDGERCPNLKPTTAHNHNSATAVVTSRSSETQPAASEARRMIEDANIFIDHFHPVIVFHGGSLVESGGSLQFGIATEATD
jgi:hypothetical protein